MQPLRSTIASYQVQNRINGGGMQGMDGSHGGMAGMASYNATGGMQMHHKGMMMMHMTFFWGRKTEVLFSGWPGGRLGMYILALVFVFALALLVEWLSCSQLIRPKANHVTAGLAQTAMHLVRVGLAYMLMLAVMSFNVGVFLVAVVGHAVGFFLFGSRVFRWSQQPQTVGSDVAATDLPPLKC